MNEPEPIWVVIAIALLGIVLGVGLAKVIKHYPPAKQPVPAVAR